MIIAVTKYLFNVPFNPRVDGHQANIESKRYPRCLNLAAALLIAAAVSGFTQNSNRSFDFGRPAPSLFPPRRADVVSFDALDVDGSFGFINLNSRIAKHCPLAATGDYSLRNLAGGKFTVAYYATRYGLNDGVSVAVNNLHTFKPISASIGRVKRFEDEAGIPNAVNGGIRGNCQRPVACPKFAVQSNADGQLGNEVRRGGDDAPSASPKVESVPISPDTVKLFRPEPTCQRAIIPVPAQCHVALVNNHGGIKSPTALNVNGEFQT